LRQVKNADDGIAWLELFTVGSLGIIMVLVGIGVNLITKRKNTVCTAVTTGYVVKH